MAYYISAETPTEITFKPEIVGVWRVKWVLLIIALPMLVLGAGMLWLHIGGWNGAVTLGGAAFALGGLGFLGMALALKAGHGDGPAAIVFDQRRAGVWLHGTAPPEAAAAARDPATGPAAVFLPFADIDALRLTVHSHARKKRPSYSTYHVVLNLADGGTWGLTRDRDQDLTASIRDRLLALMARADPAAPAPPPPALPPGLVLTQQGPRTQVWWRNPVPVAEVFKELGVMAFMATVLTLISTLIMGSEDGPPGFVYVFLALIAAGIGSIIVTTVWRWWQDSHCRYGLEFGPETVAYLEENARTGCETRRDSLPLVDYYGLSTSFDTPSGEGAVVQFLSRAAHAQLRERQAPASDDPTVDEDLSTLLTAALNKNLAQPLRVSSLSPVQRLALVQWARAETERQRMGQTAAPAPPDYRSASLNTLPWA